LKGTNKRVKKEKNKIKLMIYLSRSTRARKDHQLKIIKDKTNNYNTQTKKDIKIT